MQTLRCVIERVTYSNPDNGYSILKAHVKGYSDLVTFVGNMPEVTPGAVLLCKGDWKVDARYGRQFAVETFEEVLPATVLGIEKYLGSGLVKGIGKKYAHLIVERFGADTFDVIENDVEKLKEIDGIGPKRVALIRGGWDRMKDIREVMVFLQGYGVSTAYAAKIYKTYGKDSIQKVKDNPYCLADDIWGIGYKTADSIASKMGYEKEDPRRLRSGILYTLNQLSDEGHVYAERQQLIDTAKELLEAEPDPITEELQKMEEAKDVITDGDAIYLPPFYYAECGTASKLLSLQNNREGNLFKQTPPDIAAISKSTGITYDDVQAQAITQAAFSKVMVLTGGPGTGKTTTLNGIIAEYKSHGMRILLAAPTGRAAKRMSEATGMEAKTIHRLLEYNPMDGYKHNQENPLEGDALIVDECSMIDTILMNALLKAIPQDMRLILVGDVDQLPSVGAGNVLRDIIDSGTVPVIRLRRIFRQAQTSRIIMNAHAINAGRYPNTQNGKNSDFFFINDEDTDHVANTIVDLVKRRLPTAYRCKRSDIQVLTPMQRGVVGAANLNMLLQSAINPTGPSLQRGGYTYRQGDRVMQLRNNYDRNTFNGDIGFIESVDTEDRSLTVDFEGKIAEYDISELDELTLAYATTIHKSQGSEYPIVIIPVLFKHYVMLQRNLIYTAITRARKVCVLIGSQRALAYAVGNLTIQKRNTRLKERLQHPEKHHPAHGGLTDEKPSSI